MENDSWQSSSAAHQFCKDDFPCLTVEESVSSVRASDMAKLVMVPSVKLDDLSSVSDTHVVQG